MKTISIAEVYKQSEMQAIIVDKDTSLTNAVKQFATNHDLRGIFITDDTNRLVGIINKQDLLRWVGIQLGQRSATEPMSVGQMRRLVTAQKIIDLATPGSESAALNLNDTLADALQKMTSFNLADLPVVDENSRIINDLRLSEILLFMVNTTREG